MKKTIFRKENVFTCVMFGALLIFVVAESITRPDGIAVVAFLVAVSVFVLSLFKLAADITEDINDALTLHMKSIQNRNRVEQLQFLIMREATDEEADLMIDEAVPECNGRDREIVRLKSYRSAYKVRSKVRVVRRVLLWLYYIVFMLLLVALLLHAELAEPLKTVIAESSGITSVITLWSLIVVLFEVMIKGLVSKAAVPILENRLGFKMELY